MLLTGLSAKIAVVLQTPYELRTITCLLMHELRHRSVKGLAQGHQARQWQIWDLDPRGWL